MNGRVAASAATRPMRSPTIRNWLNVIPTAGSNALIRYTKLIPR
jgi:hypothetical protein